MNNLEAYKRKLVADVRERADDKGILEQDAFFEEACEILRESNAITGYEHAYCHYGRRTPKFIACDGYDPDALDLDESIVLIACDDDYSLRADSKVITIQSANAQTYFKAMRRFVIQACRGIFSEADESDPVYALADYIHEHANEVSRFRLYFITDRQYNGRDTSLRNLPEVELSNGTGIPVESYILDIQKLMEASNPSGMAEHSPIILKSPLRAVKALDSNPDVDTYLLFVSGETLADWYQERGSKLMESNVRSFLSMRGKVNDGIRKTISTQPEYFVAYNNGLTATASSVITDNFGCISRLDDLQIVNGGQTTASLFYTRKKDKTDLSKVFVPMKLVVVGNEAKEDLVPDISRYTNSQNKVAEADFSSNSDYQVKLQQLSQQIFTPMINGAERTHWYYERTRGQYDNERNRFTSVAERKRFEKLNPRKQRIKMVDAPKYLVCWDQKPYVASLGAQKCFAIFAKEQSKNEHIDEELNQEYFKQLVCKRIIFDTLYKHIKQANWYRGAYQANITEYAIAKYSYDLSKADQKCNFAFIWHNQSIAESMLVPLLRAGKQASDILNGEERPTQNVSEWAKKEECWKQLKHLPSCLFNDAYDDNVDGTSSNSATTVMPSPIEIASSPSHMIGETASPKTEEHKTTYSFGPRHKHASTQADTCNLSVSEWQSFPISTCRNLLTFAIRNRLLSSKSQESLHALINQEDDEQINTNALNYLLERAVSRGFQLNSANPEKENTVNSEIEEHRIFLENIPDQTWQTILQWAEKHGRMSTEILGCIARLSEKTNRLTDDQTDLLWNFRSQMLLAGFPKSQFAPMPNRPLF